MPNADQVNQIILVALSDLQDPDWNPRPFLDEVEMQSLVDFIQAGGHIPPITLLKGSDQAPWDVISGKRRREAARRAGKTYIEAIKLDITLEEAKFLAIAANRDNKPFWLGEFVAIENLKLGNPNLKQVDIIAKLGWSKKRVSYAFNLTPLLTPASRSLIYQTAQPKVPARNFSGHENTPEIPPKTDWCLTEDVAIRLIPLSKIGPLEQAQALVERALQILVTQQLTGTQTDGLVAWALEGQDLEQFSPAVKVKKARKATTPKTGSHVVTHNKPATPEVAPSTTSATQASAAPTSSPTKVSEPKAATGQQPMSESEQLAWDVLLGISVLSKIKAKVKKGERPTFGEALLLLCDKLIHFTVKVIRFLVKHGIRGIFQGIKLVWHDIIEALKITRLYEPVRAMVILLACAFFIWFALEAYFHGWMRPVRMMGARLPLVSWIFRPSQPTPEPGMSPSGTQQAVIPPVENPISTPQVVPSAPVVSAPTKPRAKSKMAKAAPMPTVVIDKNIIETEVSALPPNCKVKPFVFETNGMGLDMASHRLSDVTDSEKFTALLGRDKKRILSVQPTSTSLMMTYTDAGVGGLLGNSKLEFYWEDVKYMQTADIELSPTNHLYQVTIVVNDLKQPLTFQSASAEHIQHFVSGMEAWLRAERHNNGVLVANLPAVNQGLVLNNDGVVTALWADSPADKAGIHLGDHLWGVDENAPQLKTKEILSALANLTPGDHPFYVVTPSLWDKAQADKNADPTSSFNPIKIKKILRVPPARAN